MGRILRCVGLALALVFLPAALAQDKKPDPDKAMPKDDKNQPKDKKEALDKMHKAGKITGKLIQWGASDKGFTVQVTVPYYVINEGEVRALAQAQVNLANTNPRDLNARVNAMKAIADHQSRLYTEKKEDVKIDFTPAEEMKFRILEPVKYDDKGKPRRLTRKEREDMKGPDKTLPGYNAEADDVKQDMIVTVYIEKKKPVKTTTPKEKDDKGLTDNKPEALMILIVADPAAK